MTLVLQHRSFQRAAVHFGRCHLPPRRCAPFTQRFWQLAHARTSTKPFAGVARTSAPCGQGWLDLRSEGGLRHSFLEWGADDQRPLVLFLHANSLCAGVWGPVVQRLSQQIHAVACDLRAHGDTDAPPLVASNYAWDEFGRDFLRLIHGVTAKYGRAPTACITHSFAGDCAMMALANQSSERSVPRMILLDPVLADAEGASTGAQRLAKGTRKVGVREADGFESAEDVGESLEKLLRASLAKGSLHPEAKAAFAKFGSRCDSGGRWRLKCNRDNEAEVYANRVALADFLRERQVDADVQLVFSSKRRAKPEDQDSAFKRDYQEAASVVARCRKGSAVHVLEGVGHFLVLEDPESVAKAIDSLL
eukprot:TRINITY_DN110955_c0_g1_i1.p1 TRINITY_DN110955_c0_g1~~TRINITY_DN110955_c0_g1_i1.p1  ORF type:complete len:363 (-),score=51.79 TRINITY_DN110955_c0_g1_i1:156-1244(-)